MIKNMVCFAYENAPNITHLAQYGKGAWLCQSQEGYRVHIEAVR